MAAEYDSFIFETCGVRNLQTRHALGTSFALGSKYADRLNALSYTVIRELSTDLFDQLVFDGVPGVLVEFGVAKGDWLAMMLDHMDCGGTRREVWGFDSFEGLPDPDPVADGHRWTRGQYASSIEAAQSKLRLGDRTHAHLVKGWFQETLASAQAQTIQDIAFARVDCDLYGSSVECLRFLSHRLSNGSVLMFDDWPHHIAYGETKAFKEWVPTVPHYRFELVGFINWRMVFRVWHAIP
jgi:hypothetical protein